MVTPNAAHQPQPAGPPEGRFWSEAAGVAEKVSDA